MHHPRKLDLANKDHELLIKYIFNELAGDEKTLVEQAIESDREQAGAKYTSWADMAIPDIETAKNSGEYKNAAQYIAALEETRKEIDDLMGRVKKTDEGEPHQALPDYLLDIFDNPDP